MSGWRQDLRQGVRSILHDPGFSAVVVATLALGIGTSAAIFSLVEQVLLRPLPFPQSERLVVAWETWPDGGLDRMWASPPNFRDWHEQSADVFQELAAYQRDVSLNLSGDGEPVRVEGTAVSGSFFPVLGTPALVGRTLAPEEAETGERIAVLGHDLWRRRYGGDSRVVGKTIRLNGNPYVVSGVMPAGFRFPAGSEVWIPLSPARWEADRGAHFLDVVGRLEPGVEVATAEQTMERVATRLAEQYPDSNAGWGATVLPLQRELVGDVRPALLVLLGAVLLVLLIACTNVANLKLARAAAREPEIATRVALGASRPRLFRQLLVESLLLAGLAGAAGLGLALLALRALTALAPIEVQRPTTAALDLRLLAIAIAVSLGTGILFGLVPALHGSKPDFQVLRVRQVGGGGVSARRWRNALVVAEVSLSLVLLVFAGLLVRSFMRLTAVDPGFDARQVLSFRVTPSSGKYPEAPQIAAFYERLLDRLGQLPQVRAAGATTALPLTGEAGGTSFEPEGRTGLPAEQLQANFVSVSPGYFASMGVALLAGRDFDRRDREGAPLVVIVNQTMARKFWRGGDAVGRRMHVGLGEEGWYEIAGVVRDIREEGLDVEQRPAMYLPYLQATSRTMMVTLRAAGDPLALTPSVRQALLEIDPDQPIFDVQPMAAHLATAVARQRFLMVLVACFAGVALVLAALGIYSIIAYNVAHRSHEIGVRMALGARPLAITQLVVGQGLGLATIGVVIGVAVAFSLTRLLSGLLFEVSVTDPAIFAAVPLLLLVVASLASYVPAQRAARVDPVVALKAE